MVKTSFGAKEKYLRIKTGEEAVMALLEVKDLVTYFPHEKGRVRVVDHVSFKVDERECFGIIGESGCGKSMTATSVMQYHKEVGARIGGGEILFDHCRRNGN